MPEKVRATIRRQTLPEQGQTFAATLEFLQKMLLPYPQGKGHPRYTEFSGQGHGVWSYVYSLNASSLRVPDFFSWLFAQRN